MKTSIITSNDLLIKELEDLYTQKNMLLKSLVIIYTSAMELFENEDYDALVNKLDEVQVLEETMILTGKQIIKTTSQLEKNKELFLILSGNENKALIAPCYKKLSAIVQLSKKTMKNCQVLNAKLTYCLKNAEFQLQKNILTAKNRKIIKVGYDAHIPAKSGLNISC